MLGIVHVIDDDSAVRDVIRILCRSISAQVREYSSIEAFDDSSEGVLSGCILLDMRLPKLGGLPGVQHIRKNYPALPVIGMSAHATTRTVAMAMKAGAVDFFDKPFVPQDLLDSIQEALARSRDTQVPQELNIRLELLSRTQRQVLTLLAQGCSEEEAASALSLHKKSVQRHRRNALEKLKLSAGEEHLLKGLLES
jgi:two-component system, LuxR family, response regulator FixJ